MDNNLKKLQLHPTDTGSAPAQVACLTKRIEEISLHSKVNKKDYSSKRILSKMAAQRSKLLNYLRSKDTVKYKIIIETLGLRK